MSSFSDKLKELQSTAVASAYSLKTADDESDIMTLSAYDGVAYDGADVMGYSEEESWVLNTNYDSTDDKPIGKRYEDVHISYVDEKKNITVNEFQVNLTQEENSQFMVFELDRYYDGIDLMSDTMKLTFYFENVKGGWGEREAINVRYTDTKIRLGFLVPKEATLIAGKLKFEIHATGSDPFGGRYIWKTRTNEDIEVLKSLQGNGEYIVDPGFADNVLAEVKQAASDAQVASSQAKTYAENAQTYNANTISAVNKALDEIDLKIATLEATVTENVITELSIQYFTQDQTKAYVSERLGTIQNSSGTDITVEEYVVQEIANADIEGKLADYAKTSEVESLIGDTGTRTVVQFVQEEIEKIDVSEQLGDTGTNEDGTTKTVVQYVDEAVAAVDVSDQLVDYAKSEDVYTKEETHTYVTQEVAKVDVSSQLADYAKTSELEGVRTNTITNAEAITNIKNDIVNIQSSLNSLEGDNKNLIIQYDEVGSILHLYEKDENGDIVIGDGDEQIKVKEIYSTIITGGGGGGGSLVSTVKLGLSPAGENSLTILYGNNTSLNYNLSTRKAKEIQDEEGNDKTVYEEAVIPGDITFTLYRDNVYLTHFTVTKTSTEVQSGSVDISDYIVLGSHVFTITASYIEQLGSDGEKITVRSSADWSVNAVNLKITDVPDDTWETEPKYGSVIFPYTPIGALEKTIYFKIDDKEPEKVVTLLNGTGLTYTIPKQSHGVHTLKVWCEGNIGGKIIPTEPIEYVLMFVESGNNTPIIRIKAPTTLEQYSSCDICYNVFDPLNAIIDLVTIYDEDGVVLTSVENITSAERKYPFRPSVVKNKIITVKYKDTTESVSIEVTKFPYEINAIQDGLVVDFVPTGRTNSDVDYNVFKNNAYTVEKDDETGEETKKEIPMTWTFSDNFDWINGGWKTNENGETYFCVKSGTSVDINYHLFGTDGVVAKKDANGEYTIAGTGKEFKLIFKTTNVAQANATWLSCIDVADKKDLGIRMEAQNAYIDSSLGTLEIPYVDDDIIEFDMNIVPVTKFLDNGEPNLKVKSIPMIMTYEDGTPVQPKVISSVSTSFKQDTPRPITIGSEHCDVHIYRMKVYERYLDDKEIITNFIADARSGADMADRYIKNDIYPIEDKQKITPESVAAACPDLKVYVLSAPYFTNDKGNKVENTTIKQIHNTGTREKPEYDASENWTATNAIHNGQGTSSNEYGYSGRNLEFNMKKATITLNDNVTVVKEIQLSPTSYPTNYLNFKINIASSENANNALHQKRYNRYLPYTSVASLIDSRKKNSMEFFNCVVFIQETDENISSHREFADTDVHFYGIGNIGDSKKTDSTRVNDKNDVNEFCVEIMDWNRVLSSFPQNTIVKAAMYKDGADYIFLTDEYLVQKALYEKTGGEYIEVPTNLEFDNSKYYFELLDGKYAVVTENKNLDPEKPLDITYIYYEYVGGEYVLSEDTQIDLTKAYYIDILEHDDFSEGYTYGFRYIQNEWDKDDDPDYKSKNEAFQKPLRQKWIEFYRFVTRDLTTNGVEDAQKVEAWKTEFSNWFIFDAALYYYLYTLRYTMVDNRAKNTFWHWSKHYLTLEEAIERGISVYDEDKNLITDTANPPSKFYDINGKEIKNINMAEAAINNGYRMDFWDYDNDTSLGIDNAGKLEIPIGVEDDDVDFAGVPYFRAHDSLVFVRIAKYFADELEDAWHNTEINPVGKVFDSTGFINEFDTWQNEFPEELWRLDYERKYKRTYVGGTGAEWDNALPQSNKSDIVSTRFLTEMMNGRKKYQRRCFERNQEIYMSSKFKGEVNLNDTITLRGTGRPIGKVVPPNFTLNITPFSKMYINLYSATDKVYYDEMHEAGVPCSIPYPETTLDFIYIRGASQMQSLGDLSPMYLQTAELPAGAKLKTITLGNATEGYSNDSLKELQIGAGNKLLEELDIRNLSNVENPVLPVSNIPSLKRVYAQGSNISEAIFANNGLLEEAYLPGTLTRLELRNLHYLKSIELESYENLLHLVVMNCSEMMNNLVLDMINQAEYLDTARITNINWRLDNSDVLERLYNLIENLDSPEVILSGEVYMPSINEHDRDKYREVWKELNIDANVIPQFPVTFVNYNGEILDVQYVIKGQYPVEPISSGRIGTPTRDPDIDKVYTFADWDYGDGNTGFISVHEPLTYMATYDDDTRCYTVRFVQPDEFKLENPLIKEFPNVPYGSYVSYDEVPVYEGLEQEFFTYYWFTGWNKSGLVNGDKTITAVYDCCEYTPGCFKNLNIKDMRPVQIYALTKLVRQGQLSLIQNSDGSDYLGINDTTINQEDEFNFSMGYDIDYVDIESKVIVGKGADQSHESPQTFSGTTGSYYDTGISIFDVDRSFVLAIDYEFASGNSNGATLMQCYDIDTDGFKLSYNSSPTVTWFNNSNACATSTNREMLVIRHEAGQFGADIYTSNLTSSSIGHIDFTNVGSRIPTTNSTLVFGCNKEVSEDGTTYKNYAKGTIHWAKIWFGDLGADTCRKLASYIHEDVYTQVSGFRRHYISGTKSTPVLSFLGSRALYSERAMNLSSGNHGGWASSELKSWLNNRFYNGIPSDIKRLIKSVTISSTAGTGSTELVESNCYVYIPAYADLSVTSNDTRGNALKSEISPPGSLISYMVNDSDRVRYNYNGSETIKYYTRSPGLGFTSYFYRVDESGKLQETGYATTTPMGVVIGFSI